MKTKALLRILPKNGRTFPVKCDAVAFCEENVHQTPCHAGALLSQISFILAQGTGDVKSNLVLQKTRREAWLHGAMR